MLSTDVEEKQTKLQASEAVRYTIRRFSFWNGLLDEEYLSAKFSGQLSDKKVSLQIKEKSSHCQSSRIMKWVIFYWQNYSKVSNNNTHLYRVQNFSFTSGYCLNNLRQFSKLHPLLWKINILKIKQFFNFKLWVYVVSIQRKIKFSQFARWYSFWK